MGLREAVTAAIALGSSMGPRLATLVAAARILDARVGVVAASAVVETPPAGGVAARPFLNAVLVVSTALSPRALWHVCREVERRLGRRPARRWADRLVDVDVLLYERAIVSLPEVSIPHPRLAERPFQLRLLAETWPEAVNPWTGLPWVQALPVSPRWPVVGTLPCPRRTPYTVPPHTAATPWEPA